MHQWHFGKVNVISQYEFPWIGHDQKFIFQIDENLNYRLNPIKNLFLYMVNIYTCKRDIIEDYYGCTFEPNYNNLHDQHFSTILIIDEGCSK